MVEPLVTLSSDPSRPRLAGSTATARGLATSRHVLMVAPTSFFADYGCHVRILEEARVLRRMGHRVTVVTYYTGRDVDGLDIRRTLPIPWRRHYEVGSSRHKLGFDALLTARVLGVALADRPDVIHGHLHEGALIGGAVARLLRRPVVFDYQGSLSAEMIDHGFLHPSGRWVRAVRAVERRIDRLPDVVVTSSRRAADLLLERGVVDARRLHALPDCVNSDVFRPGLLDPAARARALAGLGIPADRRVVVYLGLLAPHQGTEHLLQAARRVVDRLPAAHFLVMGFPAPHIYRAQAEALGLGAHVTFTGRVPYDQAPLRLALGELAVAPKLSATEGNGKILNYMAMGLPTVAFDTPVSREYLGDDGRYAPPGDVDALADRIGAALADPDRARSAGERLRRRAVAEYDWSRAGEALAAVYDRLTAVVRHAET